MAKGHSYYRAFVSHIESYEGLFLIATSLFDKKDRASSTSGPVDVG